MTERAMNMDGHRYDIRNMNHSELIRYAQACSQMTDSTNPLNGYHVDLMAKFKLVECGLEWRRRHPKADMLQ